LEKSRETAAEERRARERCQSETIRANERLRSARSECQKLRQHLKGLEDLELRYPSRTGMAAAAAASARAALAGRSDPDSPDMDSPPVARLEPMKGLEDEELEAPTRAPSRASPSSVERDLQRLERQDPPQQHRLQPSPQQQPQPLAEAEPQIASKPEWKTPASRVCQSDDIEALLAAAPLVLRCPDTSSATAAPNPKQESSQLSLKAEGFPASSLGKSPPNDRWSHGALSREQPLLSHTAAAWVHSPPHVEVSDPRQVQCC